MSIKLTRVNPETWKTEECNATQYLESNEFFPHSDRGKIEQMQADIDALKKVVFILVGFIEEKNGQDFTGRFKL